MLKVVFVAADFEVRSVIDNAEFGYVKLRNTPFQVWRNATTAIVITGIGLANSAAAFHWAVGNFNFQNAINIGAAGLCSDDDSGKNLLGNFFQINTVKCLEPYNDRVFNLSEEGKSLVTSSRAVTTSEARLRASKFGELVDMECYALAYAAYICGKKLSALKLVTDFSPDCDIHANILALEHRMADLRSIWI